MPTKQEVALFELPPLPAEYQQFLETETNVTPRETMPTLNPGGKRFTVVIDGEATVLKKPDPDNEGERIPISIFKAFVVAHSTKRGRTYYETGFDDKKPGRPTCWSEDSITPDARVPAADKQHKVCNGCPQSVKGSAVADDGRETKACKEHQLVALLPSNRLDGDFPALRLKLSITSIYDGKDQAHEEQGWYAWGPYLQHLTQVMPQNTHTARVETLIKFDSTTQYPKLLFKAKRGVTTEEYIKLVDFMRANKAKLASMVDSLMPAGALPPKAGGVEDEDADDPPAPKKAKKPADDEDDPPAPKSSPKPTRKAAAEDDDPPPKKAKAKPVDEEDEEPKPKAKAKPAADADEDAEVPASMRIKKAAAAAENDEDPPAPKKAKAKPVDEDEEPKPKAKAKPADDEDEAPASKPKAKGNVRDLLEQWK